MAKKFKTKFKGKQEKRGKTKGKKENPFEVHFNRVKHDVVGRKPVSDRGLPGVARAMAVKKREKTLLQEFKVRNKSNVFLDRRIGEKDSRMDPEKKMALRIAAEKKRQFGKKSLFNLNDDEELTHGGLALTDSNLKDGLGVSDEEDNEVLDAQFVKEKHFGGGGLLTRKEEEQTTEEDKKHKSRKEWIDEIIAESKKKKAESKKEKDEQYEAVSKLNANLQSFMQLMANQTMTDEDKDKAKKTCEFRDYDMLVAELGFDRRGKAKAVDKLKTPEELVREQREKLLKLESDRVRRMQGEDTSRPSQQVLQSADGLDDGFVLDGDDARYHVSYKDGRLITDAASDSQQAGDDEAEDEGSEEDGDDEAVEEEKEEEDADDDDESDKYSDILEESESEGEEKEDEKTVKKKGTKKAEMKNDSKKQEIMQAAKLEIPYTFEVPQEYEAFWALLENRSPKEVSVIVERMIACNHPSLGGTNKDKCDDIFAYLLQTLHVLTEVEGDSPMEGLSPLLYVDPLIPHLYTLTQLSRSSCAKSLLQVIEEKYEDCEKQKFKVYPTADTYVFMKVCGLLFPTSDFIHPVVTPALAFLTQLLGQARVTTPRHATAALFTSFLLYEYVSVSKRFVPELTNVLNGLLFLAVGGKNKTQLPLTPPFKCVGPAASLLLLHTTVTEFTETKLTMTSLNSKEERMTDSFKVNVICKVVRLLDALCQCWSGQPSVAAIFAPTVRLLKALTLDHYPASVRELVQGLSARIAALPTQCQVLVRAEKKPAAIKMFEPAIEAILDGVKKRHGTKEYLEKQKLLHKVKREKKGARREIQRDTAFLARHQLAETLLSDAERKRKVAQIMSGLQVQESDYKKMKKKK